MPSELAHRPAIVAPPLWYRDPISCLQSTFGTVLAQHGENPLFVLGAGWEFLYIPDDVRPEEFYYPCRYDGDLGRALAPHHALNSSWWRPADQRDPLRELRRALSEQRLVIAAVDNFHLPFRPAFGDVHAAHLLVVHGLDDELGLIHVTDAMPPAFQGPIPVEDFLRSWGSVNPQDEQDAFFSESRIQQRCLSVTVDAPYPDLTRERLAGWLRANLTGFEQPDTPVGWGGSAGLDRYTRDLVSRARAGETGALQSLYTFGWGMQAQAALHGELLRDRGAAWNCPGLAEAGRAVEGVAHAWTALRMTGAHGFGAPAEVADDLRWHAGVLRRRYAEALASVERAVGEL
ncbi:BtrH N-terminal domain-containing protein [Streptomyces xylophagus]|uniref:BtrH N-terminal domain-containing protein n=1 Tax=Streptomyces xylophagus TaxID=285514 RepID=UPI0005B9FAFD|nr:BtrH N-terminal domain-containing protein [Streptomyces xylophagus]